MKDVPGGVRVLVAALIASAIGAADAFLFHSFAREVDLLLIVSALTTLGIHVAYDAGVNTPTTK